MDDRFWMNILKSRPNFAYFLSKFDLFSWIFGFTNVLFKCAWLNKLLDQIDITIIWKYVIDFDDIWVIQSEMIADYVSKVILQLIWMNQTFL